MSTGGRSWCLPDRWPSCTASYRPICTTRYRSATRHLTPPAYTLATEDVHASGTGMSTPARAPTSTTKSTGQAKVEPRGGAPSASRGRWAKKRGCWTVLPPPRRARRVRHSQCPCSTLSTPTSGMRAEGLHRARTACLVPSVPWPYCRAGRRVPPGCFWEAASSLKEGLGAGTAPGQRNLHQLPPSPPSRAARALVRCTVQLPPTPYWVAM